VFGFPAFRASVVPAIVAASVVGGGILWILGVHAELSATQHVVLLTFLGVYTLVIAWVVARGQPARREHDPRSARDAIAAAREAVVAAREAIAGGTRGLSDQHDDVDEALSRLQHLLDDAISRLLTSFRLLHELNARQRACAAAASDDAGLRTGEPCGTRGRLEADAAEFDRHAATVVTALQFQDMASQLVGEARQRLDHMKRLSNSIATAAALLEDAPAADDPAAAATAIARVRLQVDDLLRDVGKRSRGSVRASDVQAGEVELF
jgi:hypothetical protein